LDLVPGLNRHFGGTNILGYFAAEGMTKKKDVFETGQQQHVSLDCQLTLGKF
jgi:hypothetical protein